MTIRLPWWFGAGVVLLSLFAGVALSRALSRSDSYDPSAIPHVLKLGYKKLEPVRVIKPDPELPKGARVVLRADASTGRTTPAERHDVPAVVQGAPPIPCYVVKPENLGCRAVVEAIALDGQWFATVKTQPWLDIGGGQRIQRPLEVADVVRIGEYSPTAISASVRPLPWQLAGELDVTTAPSLTLRASFFPPRRRLGVGVLVDLRTNGPAVYGMGVAFRLGPK